MRITLISLQAVALSLFAVLGAQGNTGDAMKCPVNAPIAERDCGR
ncbi:hypothetical protein [uncultured Roseovarius sp.]|nr:hypothetical protein [uncultured Roseovarius sp.]